VAQAAAGALTDMATNGNKVKDGSLRGVAAGLRFKATGSSFNWMTGGRSRSR
jgi:hypothetical protein